MDAQQAWQAAIGQIQMEMPKASFDTWVKNAVFVKHNNNTFTVSVQNAYARDWLDSRLNTKISRLLSGSLNEEQSVEFVVGQREPETIEIAAPENKAAEEITFSPRPATTQFNALSLWRCGIG